MAKRRSKKRTSVLSDVHEHCNHTAEAHAVIARCHHVGLSMLLTGMKQNVEPAAMMVSAIIVGMHAGSMFPKEVEALLRGMGMHPDALAEISEAAVAVVGLPAPAKDVAH